MLNGPILSVDTHAVSTMEMKVSWYQLDGNVMANGETFHSSDPTIAAHKRYPFGTVLQLTNPKNHRSIKVRIADRGPFVKGRDLDISRSAAEQLGIKKEGVATLTATVISNRNHALSSG